MGIVGIIPALVLDMEVVVLGPDVWAGSWVVGALVSDWVCASHGGAKSNTVGGLNIVSVPARSIILLSAMGARKMCFISASVMYWRAASVCFVTCG